MGNFIWIHRTWINLTITMTDESIKQLTTDAESGNARSQYRLASAYFYGNGVKKDLSGSSVRQCKDIARRRTSWARIINTSNTGTIPRSYSGRVLVWTCKFKREISEDSERIDWWWTDAGAENGNNAEGDNTYPQISNMLAWVSPIWLVVERQLVSDVRL